MRYTSFTIKNYKGIQELTINLDMKPDSRVYTFVGLNESGKTTILEAINIVNDGYPHGEEPSLIPKSLKACFTGSVSVEATIELDKTDNQMIAEFLKEQGYNFYKPIEKFSITSCCEFENSKLKRRQNYWGLYFLVKKTAKNKKYIELSDKQDEWQKLVAHIKMKLLPRIIYYENFLFKFPERIYLSGERSDSPENINYKNIFEDIIQEIVPNGTIEDSLVNNFKAVDSGSQDTLDAIRLKMEDKIAGEVFSSWGRLFNTSDYRPDIFLRLGITPDDDQDCYVEIKIKENGELFYISERSLGFRWFFAFLFFTIFRKNRKTDLGETLFLLDEPASNLHSTAQKKLLETFERFVTDTHKPLKLLYTTHSHHMINPQWLAGAFIVKNNAINYSNEHMSSLRNTDISATPYKQFIALHPDQKDYFQPILDVLDYQPGLLEKIPHIIVTEGKNDYYTLRYINEVMLNNKYEKIHLYPGSGCTKNSSVIALYMAWNKDFVILLDGDSAGQKAKAAYIKEFGDFIQPNIKLYNDLTPEIGGNTMEDIFTAEEKLEITRLFNPDAAAYNKSAFNTAIQSALLKKEKIDFLSESTVLKFDKLLNALDAIVH
ncbi:AAA family ATPase [uncultured Alistipes sp.]|jgi:hypothetical protein|uniref:ATP-dependent nuclease n=1 Tax=uncultured Alistipes sp. TaxID=538949 RepID=UPI0025D26717|nr:AAA family ATPase [uncultured Alistipes sp.]